MIFLPIVQRELRVAARRSVTYWSRFGFAFVGMVAGAWMLLAADLFGIPGATARGAVKLLAVILHFFFLFRGMKLTCDCLSWEKREGTIGLLFLTDLKSHDIVLGKLVSASANCVYGLLAMFPVLAVGILYGALRGAEFIRLIAALTGTLFLSLSVGLLFSAFKRERKQSESGAALLLVFLWIGTPLFDVLIRPLALPLPSGFSFQLFSPAYLNQMAFYPIAGGRSDFFWTSALIALAEILAFLGLAIWGLPRSWRERPPSPRMTRRERAIQKKMQRTFGNASVRSELRKRLLHINPFLWLALRDRIRRGRLWITLGMLAVLVGVISFRLVPTIIEACFLTTVATLGIWYLVLKFMIADDAGRLISEQRSAGALEIILSTPLSIREILHGQWLACRDLYGRSILVFLALTGLAITLAFVSPLPGFFDDLGQFNTILLLLAVGTMLLFDAVALNWVGMWLALKFRRRADAPGSAVFRVMVFPNIVYLLLAPGLAIGTRSVVEVSFGFKLHLAIWFLLGVVNSVAFIVWSRRKLIRNFRYMATQQYATEGSSGRWGRRLGEWYAWRRKSTAKIA